MTVLFVCTLYVRPSVAYIVNKRSKRLTGAHSPVRGHPRVSKVVPLNSWGRVIA